MATSIILLDLDHYYVLRFFFLFRRAGLILHDLRTDFFTKLPLLSVPERLAKVLRAPPRALFFASSSVVVASLDIAVVPNPPPAPNNSFIIEESLLFTNGKVMLL